MTGQWFSLGTQVSSINKTDGYDITEILWKVSLNTITPALTLTLLPYGELHIVTAFLSRQFLKELLPFFDILKHFNNMHQNTT